MPRHQNFDLSTLIATLRQTKEPIDDMMESLYPDMDWMVDMTDEELKKLDATIFRCIDCGTWLGVGEMSPMKPSDCEQHCTDCRPED